MLQRGCQETLYHHPDGGVNALSTYAMWTIGNGHAFYAKYLVEGRPPTHYDVVSGRDSVQPISDLNALPIVQWGIFQSPRSVMDLHIMPNNDDFSIVTQFKTCFR